MDAALELVIDYLNGTLGMRAVVVISADAEWRAVQEIHPELIVRDSPFGGQGELEVEGCPDYALSWRLGEDRCCRQHAIHH